MTREDTVRTTPDTPRPDTSRGVRIEYRASVPRHLLGAAMAEAFAAIARETGQAEPTPDSVRTDPADMSGHRAEESAPTCEAFDFFPSPHGTDPHL